MPDMGIHSWPCRALGRDWPYALQLPAGVAPEGGWPLLIVLHGAGRSHRTLSERSADLPALAALPVALLMPEGGLGFWIDSPVDPAARYGTMLGELLAHVRAHHPLAADAAHTAIAGWSMGGFGAVRFAERHPQLVRAVGSCIGLLDFPSPAYPPASNFPVPPLFGDRLDAWPALGCLAHAGRLAGLDIVLHAAEGAFDHAMNRAFHRRLDELAIRHEWHDGLGGHDWPTVAARLPLLLASLAGRITSPSVPE